MRTLLLCSMLLPFALEAQDAKRFQRALTSGNERAIDRWVEREVHRQRKGIVMTTWEARYTSHSATYDSLVAFMRRQPGVRDAAWDKCMTKIAIWPGHSTIGMRWQKGDQVIERCWKVQEGIPGTINLFGWRPKVRKAHEHLKYKSARECAGFVEEQKKYCGETRR